MSNATTKLSLLLAIAAVALASNPDEKSFRKYVEENMKEGGSSWLESKVISHATSMVYERKDFKLFSLVDIPEADMTVLGIFGMWMRVPSWQSFKRQWSSTSA